MKWNLLNLRSDVLTVLNSDGLTQGSNYTQSFASDTRVIEMIMQNYFQTVCKGVSHCPHASLYVSKYPKIGKTPKFDMLLGQGILSM